jgi:hypothetical protein
MIRTIRQKLLSAVVALFGVGLMVGTANAAAPRNFHAPVRPFVAAPAPVVRANGVAIRPLPPAPPAPSPQPLRGFSLYNQVPFYTASVSPNLPGAANSVLSPGLLRYNARAQALANFGTYANIPPYAFWNPYPVSYNLGPVYSSGYFNPYTSYLNPYVYSNPYTYANPFTFSNPVSPTGF